MNPPSWRNFKAIAAAGTLRFVSRRRRAAVGAVLAMGLLLSGALFHALRQGEWNHARDDFSRFAGERVSAFEEEIAEHLLLVESVSSFFGASPTVDRRTFADLVRPLLRFHPDIQALEWIPRVSRSQRDSYEAAREEGYPPCLFTERDEANHLVPAAPREEYYPVFFVEPYKGNERALGFDLGSNPTRMEAIRLACDTAQPAATSRVKLVQETASQFGTLIFRAVYDKGQPSDTADQRRANLKGLALGVFRIGDICEAALADLAPAGIDIELLDGSAPPGQQFLYHHASRPRGAPALVPNAEKPQPAAGLRHVASLDVAGRKWRLVCTPTEGFLAQRTTWMPWAGLAAGLLLTALLTALLVGTAVHDARTARLASELQRANGSLETEIAHRRRAEESLRKSQERLRITLASIGDGVIATDTQRRVTQLNRAGEQLTGWTLEEARGRPVHEVFRIVHEETREPAEDPIDKVLATGQVQALANHTVLIARDGAEWAIADSAAPIRDASGDLEGVVLVFRDVTKERLRERALRKSEGELRFQNVILATQQEAAIDGILVVDRAGKVLSFNRRFVQMWGILPAVLATKSDDLVLQSVLDKLVDPQAFLQRVRYLYEHPQETSQEEIALRDGRAFDRYSAPMLASDGEYYGRVWYFHDITERKEAEETMRRSRTFLQTVIDTIPDSTIVIDRDQRIVLANARARKLAGDKDPVAAGLKCHQLSHHRDTPCDGSSDPCPVQQVLQSKKQAVVRHVHYDAQGNESYVEVTAAPVFDAAGEVVQVVESSHDITEQRRHEQQLAHLASHDPLTGLPNRRVFAEALARAAARARRGTPSALVLFDVDRFKAVNDTLGHAAGDEALVRVSRLVQEQLRTEDILARLGGDEFAILLEGISMDQARVVAERARIAVAGYAFVPDHGVQPTLSLGIVEVDGREEADKLLTRADAAMYKAKEQGRNCVACEQPAPTA